MSQGGPTRSSGSASGTPVETVTGNSGGAVPPSAGFNLNVTGNTSTGINIIGTPGLNLLVVTGIASSETQIGTIEIATNAETIAGTDTQRAVTPDDLKAKLGTQTQFALPIGGGSTAAISWTAAPTNGQILIGSTALTPALNTITAGAGISVTNGPGTITIANTGSASYTYTLVNSTPYIVGPTDQYLGVDTTAVARTVQLPNAPTTGRVFVVKDRAGTSLANNITVTTVGGAVLIDGATTFVINSAYQASNFIFNGTFYEAF